LAQALHGYRNPQDGVWTDRCTGPACAAYGKERIGTGGKREISTGSGFLECILRIDNCLKKMYQNVLFEAFSLWHSEMGTSVDFNKQ
jgi:hypothetical protein